MRSSWLVVVLLVCVHCGPSGPVYRGLRVDLAVRAPVRVQVDTRITGSSQGQQPPRVETQAGVEVAVETQAGVEVAVETQVEARVEPPPPPAPPVAVALEGAPVVEFFGVPLDGAQDVVFVLDRSGSMSQPAHGRIATITTVAPAGPAAPPAPPAPPATTEPSAPVDPADARPGDTPADPEDAQPGDAPVDPYDTQPMDAAADPSLGPAVAPAPAPVVPRKIDVAQAELIDALERLPAGTRMNVVFFNNEVYASGPGIAALEDASRDQLIQFVRETTPSGATALAPAMRAAFLMNARRVVLLSDGLGNMGGDARAVIRDAREAVRGGVRIDTVGLGGNQDSRLLRILASESGGLYQPL